MATLVLAIGASMLSSALGLTAAAAAGSIAAAIGVAAIGAGAAIIGGLIDSWLFAPGGTNTSQEGPRLNELQIQGSTEGQPIPEIFGKVRIAGQMIWATRFLEVVTTESQEVGGKGGGGGSTVTTTTYTYFGNWAFGICRRATELHRVWADGKIAYGDGDNFLGTVRFYNGNNSQNPDSLIQSKEGSGNVPAFRGVAYIVCENVALERYGNRIPNLTFEIEREL